MALQKPRWPSAFLTFSILLGRETKSSSSINSKTSRRLKTAPGASAALLEEF
jgi:hypothetical protein